MLKMNPFELIVARPQPFRDSVQIRYAEKLCGEIMYLLLVRKHVSKFLNGGNFQELN